MNIARDVGEALSHHTILKLECIDRLHLNAFVPFLQTGVGRGLVFPGGSGPSDAIVGVDGANDVTPCRRSGGLCRLRGGGSHPLFSWRTQERSHPGLFAGLKQG